jgi:hypothetical protein
MYLYIIREIVRNKKNIMPKKKLFLGLTNLQGLVQLAMKTCQILNVPLNPECHIFRLGC